MNFLPASSIHSPASFPSFFHTTHYNPIVLSIRFIVVVASAVSDSSVVRRHPAIECFVSVPKLSPAYTPFLFCFVLVIFRVTFQSTRLFDITPLHLPADSSFSYCLRSILTTLASSSSLCYTSLIAIDLLAHQASISSSFLIPSHQAIPTQVSLPFALAHQASVYFEFLHFSKPLHQTLPF